MANCHTLCYRSPLSVYGADGDSPVFGIEASQLRDVVGNLQIIKFNMEIRVRPYVYRRYYLQVRYFDSSVKLPNHLQFREL